MFLLDPPLHELLFLVFEIFQLLFEHAVELGVLSLELLLVEALHLLFADELGQLLGLLELEDFGLRHDLLFLLYRVVDADSFCSVELALRGEWVD